MKTKQLQVKYLNNMLDRQVDLANESQQGSPQIPRNTDNSLSFSITQKDSNFKYLPELMDSHRRPSSTKNKQNIDLASRQDGIDLFSLQKKDHQSHYSNSLLNDELLLLQSKLSNLQEKFLNMSTPEKVRRGNGKSGQLRKSQNQPTANTKSFIERKQCNDNTVKRREGTNGKIQSTTRFSVIEKKVTREPQHIGCVNRVGSREEKHLPLDDKSIDSMRSLERSKDKEIHQLKLQVGKCKNVCESSRVRKQRIERELDTLKEKVKQYKILQQRQKEMIVENQRLTKALHKSQTIREKQKRMIANFNLQLKMLKQLINKKK